MVLRIDRDYVESAVKIDKQDCSASTIATQWKAHIELRASIRLPNGFFAVTSEILERAGSSQVLFGTVEELANFCGQSTYIVRKTLTILHNHGFVFRRKGILLINPSAFNLSTLHKVRKEDFM